MVAALLGWAPAAQAGHDADSHSPNIRLESRTSLGTPGDIAFWGDFAVVSQFVFDEGGTHGFSVVDISDPARPRELSRFTCPGAGWDISVWRDLVFLSNDDFTPTEDGSCSAPPGGDVYGVKIVSIADPVKPVQVGSVQAPCGGSHTNTVVPDGPDRVVLYTSSLRFSHDVLGGTGCDAIIDVPLADPAAAEVVGALPGDEVEGCHGVTAFLPRRLLAAACIKEVRLYDITDARAPRLISVSANPANNGQHSASFSNDGMSLVTGEESAFYGSSTPACPGGTAAPLGALWFYDVADPATPVLKGYHQLPRGFEAPFAQANGCSAHDFNVIPLRGDQDIVVSAWYSGGLSAVDFTDPAAPREIAHYQPDLDDEARRAHYWSAYWYRDRVFATSDFESTRRSLDVFAIDDPQITGTYRLPNLNPQTQEAPTEAVGPAPVATPTPGPALGSSTEPAPGPSGCAATRARRLRARGRVVRADVLRGQRRVRRLRSRGRTVRLNLRGLRAGTYVVRVLYLDSSRRVRSLRRRVRIC